MLRDLQDINETLFYALVTQYTEELLPIIYTPTVGAGCQQFSRIFRRPRGLFLSYPHKHLIREILAHPRFDDVEVIVVTDGERILGLGDQGAGGMGIPIGKLSLYVACGGLPPESTLPIMLDVGTDNPECLSDPLYVGWRHARVRGEEYDDFIATFIDAVVERWPHVLLQWEDFAQRNAARLLERYRDRLCSFNDDIQGTAAVAAGALLAAVKKTGVALVDQRIAVLGAGSAGCGIAGMIRRVMMAEGLSAEEASSRIYLLDRDGPFIDGVTDPAMIDEGRRPFVRSAGEMSYWTLAAPGSVTLSDVIRNARPTVLVGVSGQGGAFSEAVVREMARYCDQPVIFPLSNPTANCEATLADLVHWTDGRAIVGTGSPFAPVEYQGRTYRSDQINNSYMFPGIGLAAVALRIPRMPESLFMAAARALASISPACDNGDAPLLPPVGTLRQVSYTIAVEVGMRAVRDGLLPATMAVEQIESLIRSRIWTPEYHSLLESDAGCGADN
jgi:malate dehydrogenase (oxaloacetate-decarboxylating)